MPDSPLLIAFEGGEASGKSTQAALLAEHLDALLTREPGGTQVGERIRELLLDPRFIELSDRTEALLMAAARAQHVEEVIRPALESGRTVVTDRYVGSSLAYQGVARGLGVDAIGDLSHWATGGLDADVVILIELPRDIAMARRANEEQDRLEAEDAAFHDEVVAGYRRLAANDVDRWIVVDGVGTIEEVAARVREAFEKWMSR